MWIEWSEQHLSVLILLFGRCLIPYLERYFARSLLVMLMKLWSMGWGAIFAWSCTYRHYTTISRIGFHTKYLCKIDINVTTYCTHDHAPKFYPTLSLPCCIVHVACPFLPREQYVALRA